MAYFLGEGLAQRVSRRALDGGRIWRSTVAGLVSHGPQLHYWNVLLEKYASFGGAWWALPTKIVLDQTIFALYLNAAYCVCIEAMQRRPLREIGRRVRTC